MGFSFMTQPSFPLLWERHLLPTVYDIYESKDKLLNMKTKNFSL